MSDDSSNIPSPFDVRTIKYLVGLMSRHDLSEIDLREGDLRIRLRRGGSPLPTALPALPALPTSVPNAVAASTPAAAGSTEGERGGRPLQLIKSPTPGTFYRASGPDAEPFVQVGSRVVPSTVVCTR